MSHVRVPSKISSQASAVNAATYGGDRAPYAAAGKKGSDSPWHLLNALPAHREPGSARAKGAAAANTVCSALRTIEVARRHRREPSGVTTADQDGSRNLAEGGLGSVEVVGGAASSAAGGRRRRRRPRGRSVGGLCEERGTRSSLGVAKNAAAVAEEGDGVDVRGTTDAELGRGRDLRSPPARDPLSRPSTARRGQPSSASMDAPCSRGSSSSSSSRSRGRFSGKAAIPPPPPHPPSARECWGGDGGDARSRSCSSVRASRSPSRGSRRERTDRGRATSTNDSPTRVLSWAPLGSETEDRKDEKERAMSPGLRNEAEQAGDGLFDDTSSPRSPGSPRRKKGIGQGRGDPPPGAAFLQIQRDLLKQLERLFVSIADDRRQALVALKREEALWKASAMERARRDLRREAAEGDGGDEGGNNGNSSNGRAAPHTSCRRSLEEQARERIVEEGPGAEALAAVGLVRDREEAFRLSEGGGGDGQGRGGWKLPEEVVEEMRRDFRRKLDEECNQVLEQENKALLEARSSLAEREGARTERELRELSDRLTNDGRDALASLQRQLEKTEEDCLAAQRDELKASLAHSLQEERERLVSEREVRIHDAQDVSGQELSRLAEDLWEQAEVSATSRREEAVRLLDQAADEARMKLDALLTAHEQQALDSLRERSSLERKALVKRIREEGDRRYVEDLNALAESASKKNDAWVRMTVGDLTDPEQAVGARGGKSKGRQGGAVSPALQLRAIEASEDCARLGRRLVELVMKEATMRLEESLDNDSPEPNQPGRGKNKTNSNNNNNNSHARVDNDGRGGDCERCCQDCERLARANVQLSRLLLRTAAAGTQGDGQTGSAATRTGTARKKRVGHVATANKSRATRTSPRVVAPVARLNPSARSGRK